MASVFPGSCVASLAASTTLGAPSWSWSPTTIFSPDSTPANAIFGLSLFVFTITGLIFVGVTALLVYALIHFRERPGDDSEPPQVFGSTQIELSWTIIPILIIVVLFLGTARVIFSIQDAKKPKAAVNVVVVGHQFWWEFNYPDYNVVTANELHVPVSDAQNSRPTFMKLSSADVVHSFWIPRLAGKTDLLPNRVNEMWIDPQGTGVYEGQCAQFCGAEHAKMLLRVYVDTPEQFQAWISNQQKQAAGTSPSTTYAPVNLAGQAPGQPHTLNVSQTSTPMPKPATSPAEIGREVFEHSACINCHTVRGTVADGRFGPDLTHLMGRHTIAAGAADNTPENLNKWIDDPATFKPGALMPPMHLTQEQNAQITTYLTTLN